MAKTEIYVYSSRFLRFWDKITVVVSILIVLLEFIIVNYVHSRNVLF